MQLVCSNKPRPSVQKGAKGNQFWRRDVHHIGRNKRTLCGLDASEWLEMGPLASESGDDPSLCNRCKSALAVTSPVETKGA